MDKKFQVFISSTFEDLKEERRAVTETILNLRHIPVGMELFQASDESQWTHIQRRIEDCDYYLVIVAERYGSEVKIKGQSKSYTQMEYEYAVKTGVPVAAFLLDPSVRGNWPQGRTEPEKRAKVEKFRALCGKKLCQFWKTPDDLAAKVASSLQGLIREAPRKGWVRADQLPSAAVTDELARLSEENRGLRERVEAFERQAGGVQVPPEIMAKIKYLENGFNDKFEFIDYNIKIIDVLHEAYTRRVMGYNILSDYQTIKSQYSIDNINIETMYRILCDINIISRENDNFTKIACDMFMYYELLKSQPHVVPPGP